MNKWGQEELIEWHEDNILASITHWTLNKFVNILWHNFRSKVITLTIWQVGFFLHFFSSPESKTYADIGIGNSLIPMGDKPVYSIVSSMALLNVTSYSELTHLPLVPLKSVSESDRHWFR